MEYTVWKIEGLSLELDITDADTAERYDAATAQLPSDIPETGKVGMSTPEYIRAYCKEICKIQKLSYILS